MSTAAEPTLDHLRIFAAVVDSGSFSAAARLLDRSQPAVSYGIATLEAQLGITLFQRGKRKPRLTPSGLSLLAYARRMCQLADELAASASSLTVGLEGTLVVAVDTFFPVGPLASSLEGLAATFPSVCVDVRVRSREQVLQLVMDGDAALGVSALDIAWPAGIEARDFGSFDIIGVVAPSHVLARHSGAIPNRVLRDSLQITNRTSGAEDETRDIAVNSSRIWRVSGLALQLHLILRGLGWGYLPLHAVRHEIDAGRLVQLNPATRKRGVQPWSFLFRGARPPGPAGRLLMDRLEQHAADQEN